jgi:ABC-type antimicrobial peptide transport system permease subunit
MTTSLGARAEELIGLVLRDGIRSAVVGIAVGLLGAWWAAGLIRHLLYGIEVHDPATYAVAAAASALFCAASAYLPARRAAAISPMEIMAED